MAEKSHMPYLVIVVLVAVVAVVVLVLDFRPSSEEAVAGEAFRLPSERTIQLPSDSVSLSRLNKAAVYGLPQNPELKSCNTICSDVGRVCVDAYFSISEIVVEADGNRYERHHWEPVDCIWDDGSNPLSCRCY
ncbi:hypothetical protein HYS49_00020 [Candidatus Woesearchaeota archaeon]|nr:hypothetical protein [Candidatus Woesearchaeota archaeon]